MRQWAQWISPFCLSTGTVGLLLNEFLLEWGRPATLSFAGLSVIGLGAWILNIVRRQKSENVKES